MLETYANLLVKGLTEFFKNISRKEEWPEENLSLVIKLQKGRLGAFLYNQHKFVRQVSFVELVKLLF